MDNALAKRNDTSVPVGKPGEAVLIGTTGLRRQDLLVSPDPTDLGNSSSDVRVASVCAAVASNRKLRSAKNPLEQQMVFNAADRQTGANLSVTAHSADLKPHLRTLMFDLKARSPTMPFADVQRALGELRRLFGGRRRKCVDIDASTAVPVADGGREPPSKQLVVKPLQPQRLPLPPSRLCAEGHRVAAAEVVADWLGQGAESLQPGGASTRSSLVSGRKRKCSGHGHFQHDSSSPHYAKRFRKSAAFSHSQSLQAISPFDVFRTPSKAFALEDALLEQRVKRGDAAKHSLFPHSPSQGDRRQIRSPSLGVRRAISFTPLADCHGSQSPFRSRFFKAGDEDTHTPIRSTSLFAQEEGQPQQQHLFDAPDRPDFGNSDGHIRGSSLCAAVAGAMHKRDAKNHLEQQMMFICSDRPIGANLSVTARSADLKPHLRTLMLDLKAHSPSMPLADVQSALQEIRHLFGSSCRGRNAAFVVAVAACSSFGGKAPSTRPAAKTPCQRRALLPPSHLCTGFEAAAEVVADDSTQGIDPRQPNFASTGPSLMPDRKCSDKSQLKYDLSSSARHAKRCQWSPKPSPSGYPHAILPCDAFRTPSAVMPVRHGLLAQNIQRGDVAETISSGRSPSLEVRRAISFTPFAGLFESPYAVQSPRSLRDRFFKANEEQNEEEEESSSANPLHDSTVQLTSMRKLALGALVRSLSAPASARASDGAVCGQESTIADSSGRVGRPPGVASLLSPSRTPLPRLFGSSAMDPKLSWASSLAGAKRAGHIKRSVHTSASGRVTELGGASDGHASQHRQPVESAPGKDALVNTVGSVTVGNPHGAKSTMAGVGDLEAKMQGLEVRTDRQLSQLRRELRDALALWHSSAGSSASADGEAQPKEVRTDRQLPQIGTQFRDALALGRGSAGAAASAFGTAQREEVTMKLASGTWSPLGDLVASPQSIGLSNLVSPCTAAASSREADRFPTEAASTVHNRKRLSRCFGDGASNHEFQTAEFAWHNGAESLSHRVALPHPGSNSPRRRHESLDIETPRSLGTFAAVVMSPDGEGITDSPEIVHRPERGLMHEGSSDVVETASASAEPCDSLVLWRGTGFSLADDAVAQGSLSDDQAMVELKNRRRWNEHHGALVQERAVGSPASSAESSLGHRAAPDLRNMQIHTERGPTSDGRMVSASGSSSVDDVILPSLHHGDLAGGMRDADIEGERRVGHDPIEDDTRLGFESEESTEIETSSDEQSRLDDAVDIERTSREVSAVDDPSQAGPPGALVRTGPMILSRLKSLWQRSE